LAPRPHGDGPVQLRWGGEITLYPRRAPHPAAERGSVQWRLSLARHRRHSCAMHTYQATGDVRSVSLWLGHASLLSTQVYVRADPTEKLRMLEGTRLPNLKPGRFRPGDSLIAMLKGTNRR